MYFAKKRLIGKLIGVATAIFLVLSMMPGVAWGAEAKDGSLPQEASTPSATVESPQTTTAGAATTTLPADSSAGTDSGLQDTTTPSAEISSTSSTSATTLDTGSSSAKDSVSATTLDSRDQQIQEQAQVRILATVSIKKEVSVDGVIYYDGEIDDPQIPDKIVEIGPAGLLYYRISFDGPLVDVQITDVLDDGFDYIATTAEVNGAKKEPTVTGQELKWTDLDIGAGQALTYRVFASKTASAGEPPNPYENTATADEPASTATHPTLGTDTAKVIVTNTDLRIDKKVSADGTSYSDGPVTVGPGDKVYFRVILTNNGATPFDPDSLVLADDLPEGFLISQDPTNETTPTINGEFQAADAGGGSPGAVETWTISKLLGAEGSEDIKAGDDSIVSYGDTVTLEFQATASSVPSLVPYVNLGQIIKTGDHPIYFASDTAEISVGASLTKQVSVGGSAFANEAKVKQGEQVMYKLVIANPGDADMADVGIMDALPTNFEYVGASTEITDSDGVTTKDSATTDTDPELADYNADPSILDRILIWPKEAGTPFTVKAGKTLTITYKVTATNAISSIPYENAAVALQGVSTEQAEMFASGSSKVTVILKDVKKQVSTDGTNFSDEVSVAVNAIVYYRITVTNAHAADITVSVEDTLPTGFTYQTGTTIGATTNNPAVNGQKLTWSPITATKNADTTLTFQAKAGSTIGDSNVNTARVLQDTTVELGSDTANVKVTGTPTITVTKTVDKSTAAPNETLTYTITYSNTGTVALTNVVITDVVPASTTFVSGSASDGGVFDQTTSTITWTVGSVATGTSKSVSFKAIVGPSATGTITNTASIDSNETDAKTASATTNVVVVLQTTTQQQPATLPQTGNPDGTQVAAQQLPTTLPKTGLDLLGYLFGAVALVSSGLFLRRLGRDKR
jgi:uncharacterized repeat protein (TIGR01451 family)